MDKKTKLWLGVGVVGVGAYLLMKSKKAALATTPAVAPAQFVGADSFASVGERMISADGDKFASVGARQIAADGGMINSLEVKGAKSGSQNAGVFANTPFVNRPANMVGANGWNPFKRKPKLKGSVEVGPLTDGEFVTADGTGKFFDPRTARYGSNQGAFAPSKPMLPKIKNPVEPIEKPVPVTQGAPLNNLVGADGGFFAVHDGFGK
jgi:hypothetical protein